MEMYLQPIIKEKALAIENLVKANIDYHNACVEKFGRYIDDESMYIRIIGPSWREYCQVGCDRGMINHDVPKELDFRAVYERLKVTERVS